ncbi:MAG: hypothetical protein ACXVXG_18795 [Nocardioidaceae bacterium]
MGTRLGVVAAALTAAVTGGLLTACSATSDPGSHPGPAQGAAPALAHPWAPRPQTVRGLRVTATSDQHGFRLHTVSGDQRFVPGMNLGSTTPLHQPGELAMTAADYRRWFQEMGRLGVRAVRVYTIHPPAFYDALAAYDRAHAAAPLYLVQGVYLPDESYVDPGKTLYDAHVDRSFTQELKDAAAAVHGHLTRAPQPGRASGTWHTDVSKWLMSWIIGVEWDPAATRRTDRRDAHAPYTPGTYFAATADATATERWIARHMDTLATAEAARGEAPPIAFANWPTTDPLHHPSEPLRQEDLVGVDADHVLPTRAWPGGTFASFHAYPYYPDFLRHETALRQARWHGRPDPYAGYLRALRRHFAAHMPVLVTEFGVPSSLGDAHHGPLGRDQGGLSERQALATDADLLRLLKAQGLGGGFVFSWTDEWFKRTWNTMAHQEPDRRQLWHDPLTNEQWFGVVATDSDRVPDAAHDLSPAGGPLKYVLADADASYVYLDVTPRTGLPTRLRIEADTVPGAHAADYRIDVDTEQQTAQVYVRAALDSIRLDVGAGVRLPDAGRPWHRYQLIVNRPLTSLGHAYPAEYVDVGALREGSWDPRAAGYDSLATWRVDGNTVRLRIPWAMLGLADPSARTALGEGVPARLVQVPGIHLSFDLDGQKVPMTYTWPAWNFLHYRERVKDGAGVLARAFRDVS